ncbi:hypothetical protein AQUCO_02700294v1 [Aquilegia coerulea]|uniref:Uncharacterized protein n=1 Tax=Aquilegia coerulea TaxID=218851 RepID=A0A2G5D687_AQUCA|nr:hypothetical protein AQUCO_02700294v1 [Aquilegia coerulea]
MSGTPGSGLISKHSIPGSIRYILSTETKVACSVRLIQEGNDISWNLHLEEVFMMMKQQKLLSKLKPLYQLSKDIWE